MKEESEGFGTKLFADALSRRSFLLAGATAIAATGLSGVVNIFAQTGAAVTPFTYRAPQTALDDLKQRLARTRWPERQTANDWSQGVPLAKLRELVQYWQTQYDWRRCEKTLNGFKQYRTEIDGLGFHFIQHIHILFSETFLLNNGGIGLYKHLDHHLGQFGV